MRKLSSPKAAKTSKENYKDAVDLIKGLLFNLLGMVMKVGKVLFVFVAAKFYGTSALGLYFLAWSAVDIASKFGLWGMDRSLIRDLARLSGENSPESRQEILSLLYFNLRIAFIFSLIVAAVMFAGSGWMARGIFRDAALVGPLRLLSLATPFVVLTLVLIASTKALRLMRYEAYIRQGLQPAILLGVALVLIPFKLGAMGLVLAHLCASFVASVMALVVVLRKYKHLGWPPKPLPRETRRAIFRYTTPIAAMDFLNLSIARADIILVGALLSSGSAGLYGIAVEIISVIKRVRQGFEPIFSPIVSELSHHGQTQRLQRNYVLVTRWLMAGTLLPVVAMVVFPEQILAFFNIRSAEAATVLRVLALAHGLFGTFSAAESLLVMSGRSLLNATLSAMMLVVNVAVGLLLIPRLGLLGAALGTLVAFVIVSSARIYHGYKQLHLQPFDSSLAWPFVTAMLAGSIFYLLKSRLMVDSHGETLLLFFALFSLYALIYFGGAREPEEKYLLQKLKK